MGLTLLVYTVCIYFIKNDLPPGWATITILISLFGGIQLLFLGIIGEYIGQIFDEVKNRPLYIIEDKINI
jgi:dolichol-phosphate mannosyltransferase